jgi:hypothetical protein
MFCHIGADPPPFSIFARSLAADHTFGKRHSVERVKSSEKTLQLVYPNSVKILNARKAITEWLALRPQSPYLFPNPQGQKLSRISVYNVFKKHARASGLAEHKASPRALSIRWARTSTIAAIQSRSLQLASVIPALIPAGAISISVFKMQTRHARWRCHGFDADVRVRGCWQM